MNPKGTPVNDWWADVKKITSPTDPEKTGWPTQKSLALYERIITASSNDGDMVLDPFCGCATTPIAAERLGRQWVGIDIWDGAYEEVIKRMNDNRQLLIEHPPEVLLSTEPPVRTATERKLSPSSR